METEMTHQIYAIECRDNGTSTLCEVEQGVCYYLGERAIMRRRAAQHNRMAKRKGWTTQWRAVPLPYTTSIPDWFDYT
jgi:predicted GIY-YIG superfamily endonuclease